MKQKLTKLGGLVLVLLITSLLAVFAGSGLVVADDGANPVRELPDCTRVPGEEFQVTVTFTSPAANFTTIGLTDVAPAGWNVNVDETWCTPDADASNTPTPETVEYLWAFDFYPAGVEFTAVYTVQVPAGATPGTYTFPNGTLQYNIGPAVQPVENIAGDNNVDVGIPYPITFETDPAGTGTITFAGVDYSDGDIANKTACTYDIEAHPGSGYTFVSWNTTGLVSVASPTSSTTTCTVTGAGTLKMVLTAMAPAVGGTAHPISKVAILALWIGVGAAIIVGASLLVRRRRSTIG